MEGITTGYAYLKALCAKKGLDIEKVEEKVMSIPIETPSWGYGASGTRFNIFHQPLEARDVWQKISDAAHVHELTGVCPTVAVHIPWDKVDDYKKLKDFAESKGVKIGSVNPNVFQDDDYFHGSVTNVDPAIRKKAVAHMLECIDIMKVVDSRVLSIWLSDGTNYPGQGNFRKRKRWMEESLAEVHAALPDGSRMLVEYKFFEPAFYHTDMADYGMSLNTCKKLGSKAYVLVDLGHHPLGTNIEHLVAYLIDEQKLGGFHFNSKKYADDDLTVGSINPYELFLIFNEILDGEADPTVSDLDVAYMIDQSHNVKPKIEAMLQSVDTVQQILAKALLVDRKALAAAQEEGRIVDAEEILKDAYNTDVRPLVAHARVQKGLAPDPVKAHRESAYRKEIEKERAR